MREGGIGARSCRWSLTGTRFSAGTTVIGWVSEIMVSPRPAVAGKEKAPAGGWGLVARVSGGARLPRTTGEDAGIGVVVQSGGAMRTHLQHSNTHVKHPSPELRSAP